MRAHKKKNTLRAGLLFLSVLIFLITISIIFKGVDILASSSVDGNNSYTVGVLSDGQSQVLGFSPKNSKVSILELTQKLDEENMSQILGIPLFSYIQTEDKVYDPKIFMARSILSFGKIKTDMTIIDLMRLYLSSGGDKQEVKVNPSWDYSRIDRAVSPLFTDPVIKEEKIAIEIVNATGEQGTAARLGRLITNIGGDVVLLTNSDKVYSESTVSFYGEESYTVKKLSEYLEFKKAPLEEKNIADVIITVGKDSLAIHKF